jgi:hypothetical protein
MEYCWAACSPGLPVLRAFHLVVGDDFHLIPPALAVEVKLISGWILLGWRRDRSD